MNKTSIIVAAVIGIMAATPASAEGMQALPRDMVVCDDWGQVRTLQQLHDIKPLYDVYLEATKCKIVDKGTTVIVVEDGMSADKIVDPKTGEFGWVRAHILK